MTRKQERKKRRIKKLRFFTFLLVLFLTASTCLCLFTPFFNLKTVEITGNSQLTSEEIITQSAVTYGENIFKISKRKIKKNLSLLPHIESVKVTRVPLSKIKISIKETHPDVVFKVANGYAGINSSGKIIEFFNSPDEFTIPLVLGIEAEMAKVSEKISVQDSVTFDIIMDNIALLKEKGMLFELSSIDFSDLSSTVAYLKSGTKIIFGKLTELDYKLSVLSAILPQVDASSGAYIDLSTPSNAYYGRIEETPTDEAASDEDASGTEEVSIEEGTKINEDETDDVKEA